MQTIGMQTVCGHCGFDGIDETELGLHIYSQHPESVILNCALCPAGTQIAGVDACRDHLRTVRHEWWAAQS